MERFEGHFRAYNLVASGELFGVLGFLVSGNRLELAHSFNPMSISGRIANMSNIPTYFMTCGAMRFSRGRNHAKTCVQVVHYADSRSAWKTEPRREGLGLQAFIRSCFVGTLPKQVPGSGT